MARSRSDADPRAPRVPRVGWRSRRDDAFPISVFRRQVSAPVHLEGPHAHDFFTLLLVDQGSGVVRVTGRTLELRPGDIHLMPPGEPHDTGGLTEVGGWVAEFTADAVADPGGFLGVQFGRPQWLGFQRIGGMAGGKLSLPQEVLARVAYRLESIHRELEERGPAYQLAAKLLLQLVLLDILRVAGQKEGLPTHVSPLVEEVFEVIDRRYADGLSLAQVARAVGRSASHVTAQVRQQTRLTVMEWIIERRLDEARRRLRESDEDVAIIAERVGYRSVDHFIRQFRRAHGLTPGAWRRAQRAPRR